MHLYGGVQFLSHVAQDSFGDDEDEDGKPTKTKKCTLGMALTCALCMVSSMLSGYDQGVIAGAIGTMREDLHLNSFEEEVSIGILNIAAAIGGVITGPLADMIGRKKTIAIANALFLIGSVILTFATSFTYLMLGRIVMGLGVGASLVAPSIFTAEMVPASMRGMMVACNDLADNFGILLGYTVGIIFWGVENGWRIMFFIGIIPSVLILLFIWTVPESPRWLVYKGKSVMAKAALLRVGSTPETVEADLAKIERGQQHQAGADEGEASWMDVICPGDALTRSMIFAGMGVAFFSQASGTEAIVYYSPTVLEKAGLVGKQALLGTMGVGTCKIIFLAIGSSLFDRLGRQPLLIASGLGLGFAFLVEGFSQMINSASLAVVGLCLAMSSFSLGFSPLTYVVPTEVFPTRVRAKAMSLALFTTRLLAGVISLSFLSLQELLTPEGIWFVAAAIAGLSVVFVILYVPETKGRTLEEVEGVFRHRLQQSENRVYVKFDEFAAQTRRRVTNIQCTLV